MKKRIKKQNEIKKLSKFHNIDTQIRHGFIYRPGDWVKDKSKLLTLLYKI